MKLAYTSPNFRSSLPSGADAASSTISRTAFCASSARIRNALSRARSAGILIRASHRPFDVPEQVVLRADAGIQLVDGDTGSERHAL